MKTFTKLYTALNIKEKGELKLIINKVQKDGTKRTFFRVENLEGKGVSKTLYARLYDAKNYAFRYLETI